MADDEKWGLSREEIEKRLRDLNQKKKEKGPTRGGRSSGQGVKLLYIRDFLYAHATKEHPQNANRIQDFLLTKNIEASTKTIYNDIVRLHDDFGVPVVYDAKRWGYYITEPGGDTTCLSKGTVLFTCLSKGTVLFDNFCLKGKGNGSN